jgi:hypothetical protein
MRLLEDWIQENKEFVQRKSWSEVTSAASQALKFYITTPNVKGAAEAVGVEVGIKTTKGGFVSREIVALKADINAIAKQLEIIAKSFGSDSDFTDEFKRVLASEE